MLIIKFNALANTKQIKMNNTNGKTYTVLKLFYIYMGIKESYDRIIDHALQLSCHCISI